MGERVLVQVPGQETSVMATVRYLGQTDFDEGTWIGVEYNMPIGKNDGEVKVGSL